MRKIVGIIGIITLLLPLTMFNACVETHASNGSEQITIPVVDTENLPEILTYEELCKLYSCKEDTRVVDPAIIEVDQEDAVKLMKVGVAEAGTEDPLAIAYVMMVVINRVNDDYWPDTVEGVLTQPKQFSVYKNGRYKKAVPNANAHYALYLVESGQINIEAEYFESESVKDSWQSRNREVEFTYGGHRFYK